MSELISVELTGNSAMALSLDWQNEQSFKSSEPVFFLGLINRQHAGTLAGHLIIERGILENSFIEKQRYAELNSVSVHPHVNLRRRGVGSVMVTKFEEQARKFGAAKIVGKISAADYEKFPWLINFYEKLGFTLTKKGEGFMFDKKLN